MSAASLFIQALFFSKEIDMGVLVSLLSNRNYIVVNKQLIKTFGITEAIILGELCAEYDYYKNINGLQPDDTFFCSVTKLTENTGLSDYEQRKAIKNLEKCGVLKTQLKDIPATRYFKINEDKIEQFLITSSQKIKELDFKKLQSSNKADINNKKSIISKDIIDSQPDFEFGTKSKTKKTTLWDKCVSLIDDFTDDYWLRHSLTVALKMFIDNSKESGTPFYTNNFKGKLNTLKSLSTDVKTQLDIIDQTLTHGWNNFYALKTETVKNNTHSRLNESGDLHVPHTKLSKEEIMNGEKF